MIESLRAHRARALPAGPADAPVDIGALCEYVHLGPVPDGLDLGPWSITGSPDHIAEGLGRWVEAGANHLQVRFPSRSLDELLDQIAAFGAEVLPLLEHR